MDIAKELKKGIVEYLSFEVIDPETLSEEDLDFYWEYYEDLTPLEWRIKAYAYAEERIKSLKQNK